MYRKSVCRKKEKNFRLDSGFSIRSGPVHRNVALCDDCQTSTGEVFKEVEINLGRRPGNCVDWFRDSGNWCRDRIRSRSQGLIVPSIVPQVFGTSTGASIPFTS